MLTLLLLLHTTALAECAPIDLKRVQRDARVALDDLQPAQALALVAQADESLACLDLLVTVEDLAALYQVGGTAALRLGQEYRARELFTTAARLAGEVGFDGRLGASAQELYEGQRDFVQAQDRATVVAYAPARLDGLDLPVGQEQAISPGLHLVQGLDASGAVRSGVEVVASGGKLEIGAPELPQAPEPTRHLGLAVAGTLLTLAGGAVAWIGVNMDGALGDLQEGDPAYDTKGRQRDALIGAGALGVGAGCALLATGSVLSSQPVLHLPILTIHW